MNRKKLFVFAVIASILVIQLAPALARTGTTTGGTGTSRSRTRRIDYSCLANSIVQELFDIGTEFFGVTVACLSSCDVGVGPCLACVAANFPVPPTITNCTDAA